jgi:prevent-host-death family protein
MEQIGVRELRQHASVWLRRVAAGEAFEVTDRGRPVALLSPLPADRWQRLVDSGVVVPADDPGDLTDLRPVQASADVSAALRALRRDER